MTGLTPRERLRAMFVSNWLNWAVYATGCIAGVMFGLVSWELASVWAYVPVSAGAIVLWDMLTPPLRFEGHRRSWPGDGYLYERFAGDRE